MKKLITMTLAALTMMGGVALADRDHRGRGRDHDRGRDRHGPVVRGDVRVNVNTGYRSRPRRVRYERRVVRPSGNYFRFHGGVQRRYTRPVIQTRYYDSRVRPRIVSEQMAPVEGYLWIAGQWAWDGREWQWQAGYYAPDPNYGQYGYYDDYNVDYSSSGYYDEDGNYCEH
jgi:hypothetical protein